MLAEGIAGSEEQFAELMNAKARDLAVAFCRVLNDWLTPAEIADVNERNRTIYAGRPGVSGVRPGSGGRSGRQTQLERPESFFGCRIAQDPESVGDERSR